MKKQKLFKKTDRKQWGFLGTLVVCAIVSGVASVMDFAKSSENPVATIDQEIDAVFAESGLLNEIDRACAPGIRLAISTREQFFRPYAVEIETFQGEMRQAIVNAQLEKLFDRGDWGLMAHAVGQNKRLERAAVIVSGNRERLQSEFVAASDAKIQSLNAIRQRHAPGILAATQAIEVLNAEVAELQADVDAIEALRTADFNELNNVTSQLVALETALQGVAPLRGPEARDAYFTRLTARRGDYTRHCTVTRRGETRLLTDEEFARRNRGNGRVAVARRENRQTLCSSIVGIRAAEARVQELNAQLSGYDLPQVEARNQASEKRTRLIELNAQLDSLNQTLTSELAAATATADQAVIAAGEAVAVNDRRVEDFNRAIQTNVDQISLRFEVMQGSLRNQLTRACQLDANMIPVASNRFGWTANSPSDIRPNFAGVRVRGSTPYNNHCLDYQYARLNPMSGKIEVCVGDGRSNHLERVVPMISSANRILPGSEAMYRACAEIDLVKAGEVYGAERMDVSQVPSIVTPSKDWLSRAGLSGTPTHVFSNAVVIDVVGAQLEASRGGCSAQWERYKAAYALDPARAEGLLPLE